MSMVDTQELSSVINRDELMTRCLNNLDFAERMLKLFQEQFCEELAVLETAYDQGNFESVAKIAHRLQGACANAAAFGLQDRAANLRNAVKEGAHDKAVQCLTDLQQEWKRFSTVMATEKL
jgi:HPt (histidine-containing phosphotransfer) domain-containing protein